MIWLNVEINATPFVVAHLINRDCCPKNLSTDTLKIFQIFA